ncbi:MAG: ankyrin repeat domain-containing protein [Candidatus Babeliales bacterium]
MKKQAILILASFLTLPMVGMDVSPEGPTASTPATGSSSSLGKRSAETAGISESETEKKAKVDKEETREKLYKAIEANDVDGVTTILKQNPGMDIETPVLESKSKYLDNYEHDLINALQYAAESKVKLPIITALIRYGANPNVLIYHSHTASLLTFLLDKYQEEESLIDVVELLIKHNACVDGIKDQTDNSPLIQAMQIQRSKQFGIFGEQFDISDYTQLLCVKRLLDAKANPNLKVCYTEDPDAAPIHCAIPGYPNFCANTYPICELLLIHKSNVNAQNWSKETALLRACCSWQSTIEKDKSPEDTLWFENSTIKVINLLLNTGADINIKDEEGNTVIDKLSPTSKLTHRCRQWECLTDHTSAIRVLNAAYLDTIQKHMFYREWAPHVIQKALEGCHPVGWSDACPIIVGYLVSIATLPEKPQEPKSLTLEMPDTNTSSSEPAPATTSFGTGVLGLDQE